MKGKKKKGVLQDLCFLLGITFASSSKRKRVRFLFIFKSKECTGHTWDHKTIVFNFLFYLALDVKKKTHEEKEDFKKMSLNTITMKHQFKKKKDPTFVTTTTAVMYDHKQQTNWYTMSVKISPKLRLATC